MLLPIQLDSVVNLCQVTASSYVATDPVTSGRFVIHLVTCQQQCFHIPRLMYWVTGMIVCVEIVYTRMHKKILNIIDVLVHQEVKNAVLQNCTNLILKLCLSYQV